MPEMAHAGDHAVPCRSAGKRQTGIFIPDRTTRLVITAVMPASCAIFTQSSKGEESIGCKDRPVKVEAKCFGFFQGMT